MSQDSAHQGYCEQSTIQTTVVTAVCDDTDLLHDAFNPDHWPESHINDLKQALISGNNDELGHLVRANFETFMRNHIDKTAANELDQLIDWGQP